VQDKVFRGSKVAWDQIKGSLPERAVLRDSVALLRDAVVLITRPISWSVYEIRGVHVCLADAHLLRVRE